MKSQDLQLTPAILENRLGQFLDRGGQLSVNCTILEVPIASDGGRYFSKVTSYVLLITSRNVTRYSYILL